MAVTPFCIPPEIMQLRKEGELQPACPALVWFFQLRMLNDAAISSVHLVCRILPIALSLPRVLIPSHFSRVLTCQFLTSCTPLPLPQSCGIVTLLLAVKKLAGEELETVQRHVC